MNGHEQLKRLQLNFLSYEKKQLEKICFKDIPAWLSLILAAHHVQLRGARRESPSW